MGVKDTDREGAQPPQCPPGSIPPAPGDRIGMGKQQAGSPPSSIPTPGLIAGFATGSMRCLSHLMYDVAQGSACKHLSPPLPTDGWAPEGVHPWGYRAVLCHAVCPAGESCLIARHRALWSHTHTEGRGAEPSLPLPSPASLPVLHPRCWPDPSEGVPVGQAGKEWGKGWSRLPPDQGLWSLTCLDAATHT